MSRRFRSKPTEINAIQWTGENYPELLASIIPVKLVPAGELKMLAGVDGAQGWVHVPVGHYLVWDPSNENDFWPVEQEYFENKYEPIDASWELPDALNAGKSES